MTDILGKATYDGINQIQRCEYTQTNGVVADTFRILMIPQTAAIAASGKLTFFWDGNVVLALTNCRLDVGSQRLSDDGLTVSVMGYDRRWRWKDGEINGRYNVLLEDGTIEDGTEATPQTMAALLLMAMGESGYDVSALPNSARPQVHWVCANPAFELQKLCKSLGCEVSLQNDTDTVEIVALGSSSQVASLPTNNVNTLSFGFDRADLPDTLKICGKPSWYQAKLKLEAVLPDEDGTVTRFDEVSYKPADNWQSAVKKDERPAFQALTATGQALADRYLWRLFRVSAFADGSLNLPGFGVGFNPLTSITQIFPLNDFRLERTTDLNGVDRNLPPTVNGVFYAASEAGQAQQVNTDVSEPVETSVRVFGKTGLVLLGVPVWKKNLATNVVEEPELYLTTSFPRRDATTGMYDRYFRTLATGGGGGTGARIIHSKDYRFNVIAQYPLRTNTNTVTGVTSNLSEQNAKADTELAAILANFTERTSYNRGYNGLFALNTDGQIREITWKVSDSNSGHGMNIAINAELHPYVMTARQKLRMLEIEHRLATQAQEEEAATNKDDGEEMIG